MNAPDGGLRQDMWQNFLRLSVLMGLMTAVSGMVGACTPTVASRGAMIDPDRLAEIKPGDSREAVASKLGSPTLVSSYDDKVWYYVGRETEQVSFLDPTVKEQKAVEVRFDDQGQVVTIAPLDVSASRDIQPVEQKTPTFGNDNTFIQQLLGNLSRPVPHMPTHTGQ